MVMGITLVMFMVTNIVSPKESLEGIKKREKEYQQYREEVKKYTDEIILDEIINKNAPVEKIKALIGEMGKRGLEKGRPILEKFIADADKVPHEKRMWRDLIIPEVEYGRNAKVSLLRLDFKSSGKDDKEYLPFLLDKIRKFEQHDETFTLLGEITPVRYEEIGKHLLANKEDAWLSINLLNALGGTENDKVQSVIVEYLKWCRKTKRDKNEVSYTFKGKEIKVLIYSDAQMALSSIGNRQSLEIFKEDLGHMNTEVRRSSVYGIGNLIKRKVIDLSEIDSIINTIKDDKDSSVQEAYKNLQRIIRDIKEEEKSKQNDSKPKDSPDKSGKDDTDHSGDKSPGQDKPPDKK